MQIKTKVQLLVLILSLSIFFLCLKLFAGIDARPPLINGVLIPDAKPIAAFSIIDHNQVQFSNRELQGKWSVISYGYTSCPDICPTTLSVLSQLVEKLANTNHFKDLNVFFYTIDHQRDTAEFLREYVPFFNPEFIGLTYVEGMQSSALGFEKSLGMRAILTPIKEQAEIEIYGKYKVSHGTLLYLINPEGELQAVFKPLKSQDGRLYFSLDGLFKDYLAVREYFT